MCTCQPRRGTARRGRLLLVSRIPRNVAAPALRWRVSGGAHAPPRPFGDGSTGKRGGSSGNDRGAVDRYAGRSRGFG